MIAANLNRFLQSLIAKVVFRADTMKLMENAPGITSIMFGTLFSVFTGMVYIYMLHEPGSLFYLRYRNSHGGFPVGDVCESKNFKK